MNDIERLRDAGFGTNQINHNLSLIEESSFESLLSLLKKDLAIEIDTIKSKLQVCADQDEMREELNTMLEIIEQMHSHFEFTLAVLETRSEKEVEVLKEHFSSISAAYDKLKTKDDFALTAAKIVIGIFHDKMVLELKKIPKRCFKTSKNGEVRMVKKDDNLALIKIMINRFEAGCLHYPSAVSFDKNDLLNYPKSSEKWQDIYQSAVFRRILSKEEARENFKLLHLASNLGHIIIKRQTQNKDLPNYKAMYNLMKDIVYFGLQQSKAETQALVYLINPQVEDVFKAWNLIDHPVASKIITIRFPLMGYDGRIFIPRLFPRITKELILKEYEENTINKIVPMTSDELRAPDLLSIKKSVLKDLFKEGSDKIPIRILSMNHIDVEGSSINTTIGLVQKATKIITAQCSKRATPTNPKSEDGAIIIHLHGGGFIAMSSASMKIYLSRWCKNLKMVCFSVDYSKAPKNPYPEALDDIWQSYLWIMNYSETILGIKNKKVILAGDSSGGNLAFALTLRIIKAGLPPPQGLLMVYPCLLLDLKHASPSSFQALDDPMLHISLLKLCIKSYVGKEFKGREDPFISPVVASDELLEKLPPVRIITGSEDPMQDDNWRLVEKLRKLNKNIKIIVHEHLSHAFMAHQDLKDYNMYIEEACELIRELVNMGK